MTDVQRESASFRDPTGTVFYVDDRVLRGLDDAGAADYDTLAATAFFPELLAEGKVVGTTALDESAVPEGAASWARVLEHDRVPFVSYPYEWSFSMLRDAAALHLDVLLAALGEKMTMKDGTAFNVQWRGATPVFIDVGSFERAGRGPWIGYRQFCGTFLYPLMLEAHLRVPFQRYLLGHLDGLEPTEMRHLLVGRRRFKKGVFRHVYLHSVAESRVTGGGQALKEEMGKAGFDLELTRAMVTKLRKLVGKLRSRRADSAWSAYRDVCSYSDDDTAAKETFVRSAVEGRGFQLAWDLGCNDGRYARLVAQHAGYVIALDGDDVVVDTLYRKLREDGVTNIQPMVMDLTDPSPARGWRGVERRSFEERSRPDLVLALALVHHLAIASNVPLDDVVGWFRSLDATVVVEFAHREDPMVKRLLANKQAGLFDDYGVERFDALLADRFTVERRLVLPGDTRTLYLCTPRP
jgi:hypothetical protein